MTQAEKGRLFRALHGGPDTFIIPNPWDAGTARLLAGMRFPALATTSAGHAFAAGRPDGAMRAIEVMAHVATIVSATDLPVSADLENGFGDAPETVADTLRQVAAAGAVGGSIEDARDDGTLYDLGEARDRMAAGAEAVRALSFPFTLTGRAENFLHGHPDLSDTIRRLQAYQEAGADVLYAPGLTRREDIAAVVTSVDRPVNVLMGLAGNTLSLADLADLGVRRVSVGSALSRLALGAVRRAAEEMRSLGTFQFADQTVSYREVNAWFQPFSGA